MVFMADYSLLSDEELASSSFSAVDSDKTAVLIARYSGRVFSVAAQYAHNADYEELVSDGMVALLNAIASYDLGKGSFSAYASVCISNRMKNTVDRAVRRSSRFVDQSELESLADNNLSPEEIVILKESASTMTDQMGSLLSPLEHRCIDGIVLGLSYAEIAEKLGIDKKSVDNAVARARAKLKAKFPDF